MKDQHFHKELSTARKLAQLYKEAEAERCRKVAELEGIVLELQKHLKASPLGSSAVSHPQPLKADDYEDSNDLLPHSHSFFENTG